MENFKISLIFNAILFFLLIIILTFTIYFYLKLQEQINGIKGKSYQLNDESKSDLITIINNEINNNINFNYIDKFFENNYGYEYKKEINNYIDKYFDTNYRDEYKKEINDYMHNLFINNYERTFQKGMIISWYGYLNKIPKDWALCDGSNGTPDLRDKFIIGGGKTYDIGETGGKSSITLEKSNLPPLGQSYFSGDSHNGPYHHYSNGFLKYIRSYSTYLKSSDSGDNWGSVYMIDLNEGLNSSPIDVMNPYYSLFFIMKL